jgi:hypothetical protein
MVSLSFLLPSFWCIVLLLLFRKKMIEVLGKDYYWILGLNIIGHLIILKFML